ncbi:glycosyltransferase family 2 protein [Kaistia terrae]|uniref:Glycosyltransferase family 2 protein n=1 Tax=Kaistia terrae TaxID=537017 RepID=A0ABW0PT61_9HYPH|nr:glycosyltransferase family A protein [Kaistia terrae]MCX5578132.1 glycosyltransferase family A protein [Kaistia terrae]
MKSATSSRVSVVIPAFNAEAYLAEAVASVLEQTVPATEIILVDDGSTDGTGDIARSVAAVTYVRQANAGVAAALNHGARIASGDCIAFLSADDIWCPDKLARQSQALQDAPNRLVFGPMQHFVSPELTPAQAAGLACPPEPMPAFSAGTLLTRLDTFRAIGPLNESFKVGEFLDWYGRARDGGAEVIMLDTVVSRRRVHLANQSTKALREKSYAPVLKAMLDRRRSAKEG